MLFINATHPALAIYNPDTGEFVRFVSGRLEIGPEDPNYALVLAEAARNAYISVHDKVVTCVDCGQAFTGGAATLNLGTHRKEIHFDKWLADKDAKDQVVRDKLVKARAGFVCDVCSPVQEFGTTEDLAAHVQLLHANRPELTESGETIGGEEGFGGAVVEGGIPAATAAG